MTVAQPSPPPSPGLAEPAALTAAVRTRLGLIALLFGLAAAGWWITAVRMRGMDTGPGTDPGALGFFLGVWVVMMAAMMFPSVSPTVALFSRLQRQRRARGAAGAGRVTAFVAGYLASWTVAGVGAYLVFRAGRAVAGDTFAWDRGGRWLAGGVLLAAAAWQLTPLKDACLTRCRSPLGLLMGSWRDGTAGAFGMGARAGAWCVGCCWGLMAALFALGVMSVTWMAVIAGLIALEKTVPWRRAAGLAVTVLLLALAVAVVAAPERVPALTVPGGGMGGMSMSS
jgi:predicted metal-binding membrane protein